MKQINKDMIIVKDEREGDIIVSMTEKEQILMIKRAIAEGVIAGMIIEGEDITGPEQDKFMAEVEKYS